MTSTRSSPPESAPAPSAAPTAAALIIGNELLTGKFREQNVEVLARELFGLGIELRRVVICPDEVDVIATDLDALRAHHDHVFTSGGVGPTHDDVTIRAVAQAFGCAIVRAPRLEELLRAYFGARLVPDHLRMADVPEGAELVGGAASRWPTVRMGNVFILPGLPEIFRRKMPVLREVLAGDAPFTSRAVRTSADEGEIAALLEAVVAKHPKVAVGSYPRFDDGPVRVTITIDSRDAVAVDAAMASLCERLGEDRLVSADASTSPFAPVVETPLREGTDV